MSKESEVIAEDLESAELEAAADSVESSFCRHVYIDEHWGVRVLLCYRSSMRRQLRHVHGSSE